MLFIHRPADDVVKAHVRIRSAVDGCQPGSDELFQLVGAEQAELQHPTGSWLFFSLHVLEEHLKVPPVAIHWWRVESRPVAWVLGRFIMFSTGGGSSTSM